MHVITAGQVVISVEANVVADNVDVCGSDGLEGQRARARGAVTRVKTIGAEQIELELLGLLIRERRLPQF